MTANEMYDNFLLLYDLNGAAAAVGFEEEEVFSFLNKGQMDLVKEVFLTSGPEPIETLIETYSVTDLTPYEDAFNYSNAYYTSVPSDYLFYINSRTYLTRTTHPAIVDPTWVENTVIKAKNINKFIVSYLNKPIFYRPKLYITNYYGDDTLKKINVIVDNYTTVKEVPGGFQPGDAFRNFIMNYIRVPSEIVADTGDCELNEKWHQDIVNRALVMALMVTNDVRTKGTPQPQQQQ